MWYPWYIFTFHLVFKTLFYFLIFTLRVTEFHCCGFYLPVTQIAAYLKAFVTLHLKHPLHNVSIILRKIILECHYIKRLWFNSMALFKNKLMIKWTTWWTKLLPFHWKWSRREGGISYLKCATGELQIIGPATLYSWVLICLNSCDCVNVFLLIKPECILCGEVCFAVSDARIEPWGLCKP